MSSAELLVLRLMQKFKTPNTQIQKKFPLIDAMPLARLYP